MNPISTAGRALSGWKDSRVRAHQPDCASILGQNETQIENFIVKLFHCSVTEMHPRGKLWPLAKCLFATFLMHLSEMRIKYPEHLTLKTVGEKSLECGLNINILLGWGAMIRNKWTADNMTAAIDSGESLIPILLERVVLLEKNSKAQQEVRYIQIH